MEPTNNKASTRTWNVHNKSWKGDYAKYNPWRAPGHAIPLNGCGIASGFKTGGFERYAKGGKKTFYQSDVPNGYQAGDHGTKVAPVKSLTTTWTPGGIAEVMFGIDVNHGGGYQYRLCPKSPSDVTEECFQANPLSFATKKHIIRYSDGSRVDFEIDAVDVTEGVKPAGSTWRRFPVPTCNCDLGTGCTASQYDSSNRAYSSDAAEGECKTGLQFPKSWDEGFGYYGPNKKDNGKDSTSDGKDSTSDVKKPADRINDKCLTNKDEEACKKVKECKWTEFTGKGTYCWGANADVKGKNRRLDGHLASEQTQKDKLGMAPEGGYRWHIVDKVIVPKKNGSYVLSWRWDCEQTPQIWTNCADIVVKDASATSNAVIQHPAVHGFIWIALAIFSFMQ